MKAMQLAAPGTPLKLVDLPMPRPAPDEIVLRVLACGVCRTDLHVVDGELTQGKMPIVPGHEIVGSVAEKGSAVERFAAGDRVGVPWLGHTCGRCEFCMSGRENLCDAARFTGYHRDGGYAQYVVADQRFCFPIPSGYDDVAAAPLLCAGLIGYRALRFAGEIGTSPSRWRTTASALAWDSSRLSASDPNASVCPSTTTLLSGNSPMAISSVVSSGRCSGLSLAAPLSKSPVAPADVRLSATNSCALAARARLERRAARAEILPNEFMLKSPPESRRTRAAA